MQNYISDASWMHILILKSFDDHLLELLNNINKWNSCAAH
jgi:hypothetical protein